jgi:hypothetical protein
MRFSMPFQSKEEAREELCRLALDLDADEHLLLI